jgi:hypothetical protein
MVVALAILLLAVCVAAILLMRDRTSAPSRRVSRALWCDAQQNHAVVEFVERVQTGMVIRSVLQCSLRGSGHRCGEECRDLPASAMRPGPVRPGR